MDIGLVALWAALAFGAPTRGEFYLEGPASQTRADAATIVEVAVTEGYRAHVERRYRHGFGWEYVPVVEGFEERVSAAAAAAAIADRTGRGISVYATTEGDEPGEAGLVGGAPEEGPADDASGVSAEGDPARTDKTILQRTVRALGGPEGGIAVLEHAQDVLFRFRRTVPGGPVVLHTYARRGDQVHVEVQIESGEGRSSRIWILDGAAWLAVGERAPSPQDLEKTTRRIETYSPEHLFSFPLGFARATAQRDELAGLREDGEVEVGGTRCYRLIYEGDRDEVPFEVDVDMERLLVARVRFTAEAADLVHEYGDYREVGTHLVMPFTVKTFEDSALVDEVEVLELDLAPALPAEWFSLPPPQ
jgi:hypothetical protein